MPTKKVRILSVAMAGGLVLTGVTTAVIAPGHAPARAALAANTASSPSANLDNCPTLAEGYQDGCVSQLQTELNAILGLNLSVDGTFGPATKTAVETFQQEHNIVPADGIVGPQTKAALDNPGSSTAGTPPGQLNPGQQITSGTQIASPDGRYVLQMQGDGNLVLRAPGNIPLGDTHTAGHDGTIAVMQTDGNFVLRAPGNIPVWASGTDGHPGTVLQVQDDGNVVLYAPGHQALRVLFPASPDSKIAYPPLRCPRQRSLRPDRRSPRPAPRTPAPRPVRRRRRRGPGRFLLVREGLAPFQPGSDTPTDTCHRSDAGLFAIRHAETRRVRRLLRADTAALTKAFMSGQDRLSCQGWTRARGWSRSHSAVMMPNWTACCRPARRCRPRSSTGPVLLPHRATCSWTRCRDG